jgi:amidase
MNYSAIAIPITKADKEIDVIDTSYQPLNDLDRKNWEGCKAHRSLRLTRLGLIEADDPELYHGGPVGLQLVARKFEEEKILAIAKIVLAAMELAKAKNA